MSRRAASEALIDLGRSIWKDYGPVAGLFVGTLVTTIGAIVTAVGGLIDAVTGVLGKVVEWATDGLNALGSIFAGADGAGKSKTIGATDLDLGVLVNSTPWASRWGKNWEDVSGSWSLTTRDGSTVDEMNVDWTLEVGGWGIDPWTLNRSLLQCAGTLVSEGPNGPTRYHQRFNVRAQNVSILRVSCAGRCPYGGDGGMVRVTMRVTAHVTHQRQTLQIAEYTEILGLSL